MKRPRVSVGQLLVVIAVASLGFAAVGVASPAWAGGVTSFTMFSLVASLLGIVFGRGSRRVYWTGFTLLGWANFFLATNSWFALNSLGLLAPAVTPPIYDAIHSIDGFGYEQFSNGMGGMGGGMGGMGGGMGGGFRRLGVTGKAPGPPPPIPRVNPYDFRKILVKLETLLWAVLGGWAARYFASGRGGHGEAGGSSPSSS